MLSSAAWNQSSAKMEDVPAGWKGKGVLMVSGRRSSDPSSLQPVPKKVGFTDTTDTLSKKCGVFFVSLAKVNRKERLEVEGGMLVDKKDEVFILQCVEWVPQSLFTQLFPTNL